MNMSKKEHEAAKKTPSIENEAIIPMNSKELKELSLSFFNLRAAYYISIGTKAADNQAAVYYNIAPNYYYQETISDEMAGFYKSHLHQHDAIELLLVLSGTIKHCIEGKIYEYKPGSCCVLNKWVRHQELLDTNSKIIALSLSDTFLLKLIQNNRTFNNDVSISFVSSQFEHMLKEMKFKKSYLEFLPHKKTPALLQELSSVCERMVQAARQTHVDNIFSMMGAVSMLFQLLGNKEFFKPNGITLENSNEEQLFLKITQMLDDHHGNISRTDLASELHYNPDYVNRIVKKQTGKSFSEYARTFSIETARMLLLGTNYSIREIMEAVGFSNKTFFYQSFRACYGMTPYEYRKLNQNKG